MPKCVEHIVSERWIKEMEVRFREDSETDRSGSKEEDVDTQQRGNLALFLRTYTHNPRIHTLVLAHPHRA
jgi:hypothetical protein